MIEQCFEDLYEMEQMASEILSSSPVENALITFESSAAQAGLRANGLVMARQQEQRSIQIVPVDEVSVRNCYFNEFRFCVVTCFCFSCMF